MPLPVDFILDNQEKQSIPEGFVLDSLESVSIPKGFILDTPQPESDTLAPLPEIDAVTEAAPVVQAPEPVNSFRQPTPDDTSTPGHIYTGKC